jgi:hypothetical protein
MKTILDTCQPRDQLRTGELRDQMFAALLREIVGPASGKEPSYSPFIPITWNSHV